MWYEHTNAHVYSSVLSAKWLLGVCDGPSVCPGHPHVWRRARAAHVLGFGDVKKSSSRDTETCRRFVKLCWTCGGFWYEPACLQVPLKYDERQIVSAGWGYFWKHTLFCSFIHSTPVFPTHKNSPFLKCSSKVTTLKAPASHYRVIWENGAFQMMWHFITFCSM